MEGGGEVVGVAMPLVAGRLPPVDTPRMLGREVGSVPMDVDQYGSNLAATEALDSPSSSAGSLPKSKTSLASPAREMEVLASPARGGGRARAVGSGITAAFSPVPSASSTPCSSPTLHSASSPAILSAVGAKAGGIGVPATDLSARFDGEAFVENLMEVEDCVDAFEEMREVPVPPAQPRGTAATVSPPRASRSSARAASSKASKMMDKAMELKANKSLKAVEAAGKAPRQKARGGAHGKGASKVH